MESGKIKKWRNRNLRRRVRREEKRKEEKGMKTCRARSKIENKM